MKILIPFSYYYPETCAGIYIVDDVMEAAAKEGIESLLTVPTPTRDVPAGAQWKKTEKKHGDYVTIHRFRMYGEGKNPIGRALRYLLCEIVQLYYCLFKRYDVLFIDSTPPIQGLKLPLVKLFRRNSIVYNVQDLFPDSLAGTGLARKDGLLWKIGTLVMKITYACCDKLIVISNDLKENLITKGVSAEKIEVVYNWVDHNTVVEISREKNILFDKYQLDRSKFYVTYCGNIGLTQNMDMLVEVAKALESNEEIQFVLVGNGAYLETLKEIITRRDIHNITLLPFQDYADISHVFSLGDVGMIISKPGVGANSLPSKTWSIMSASRPVLANFDENEIKHILEDNHCGIFTKAGDKVAFTEAILKLYKERALREEMGKNGRAFVMQNLTKEVGTQKYVEVIKRVAER